MLIDSHMLMKSRRGNLLTRLSIPLKQKQPALHGALATERKVARTLQSTTRSEEVRS